MQMNCQGLNTNKTEVKLIVRQMFMEERSWEGSGKRGSEQSKPSVFCCTEMKCTMLIHGFGTSRLENCNVIYLELSFKMTWQDHLMRNTAYSPPPSSLEQAAICIYNPCALYSVLIQLHLLCFGAQLSEKQLLLVCSEREIINDRRSFSCQFSNNLQGVLSKGHSFRELSPIVYQTQNLVATRLQYIVQQFKSVLV